MTPDANCYTLPDGSCVGSNCMHDPQDSVRKMQKVTVLELAFVLHPPHPDWTVSVVE